MSRKGAPATRQKSLRERRRSAERGRTTLRATIPHPPDEGPSWAYWWCPRRAMWFRHRADVAAFISALNTEQVPRPEDPDAFARAVLAAVQTQLAPSPEDQAAVEALKAFEDGEVVP